MAYSRAVVAGEWCFVSGTTGVDYASMTTADGVVAQGERAFQTISDTLSQAGFSLQDIVRVHYILPDAAEFPALWPVMQRWLGDVRPAATMFVAGLVDPALKVEIEVTAYRPRAAG